jgi:hypothetical protein
MAANERPSVRRPRRIPGRLAGAGLMAAVLVGAAGCHSFAKPEASASSTRTTTTSSAPTTTTPPPPPTVWPLTGVQTDALVSRPALAVKIENSIDARPQTGLNDADMVWEEVVEGGITRFVAVYQSTIPAEIGPVRSVRPMDPSIAVPLHGVLAFSGGAAWILDIVKKSGIQTLSQDAGNSGFYRVNVRSAPHNVYATPQALIKQADAAHSAPPQPQFSFALPGGQPTVATAGTPASTVKMTISGVSHPTWTWSAPDGKWLRSESTTPSVGADRARLAATNVVVVRVDVVLLNAFDPAGNRVPETQLVGTGEAMVASGGKTMPATWTKTAVDKPLVLTDASGNPVALAPGNTWVELVPKTTGPITVG